MKFQFSWQQVVVIGLIVGAITALVITHNVSSIGAASTAILVAIGLVTRSPIGAKDPSELPTVPTLPKDPPSGPLLALLFVAATATVLHGCAGASDAEKAAAAESSYGAELAKCASTEPTREASQACRARVNAKWGVVLDGGAE